MHPMAARRILRLALGTALSLCISQMVGWPMSFIAPVFTLLILALPLPAPGLRQGLVFVVALLVPLIAGLAFLPLLEQTRWAGILLVALALFYSFYYTARGGSAVLGTFMTVGLTLVVTIGSVSPGIMIPLIQAMAVNAIWGMAFVWIAHALLPDAPAGDARSAAKAPAPEPEPSAAARSALRSLLIVLPMALLFLYMSGSPAYTVVMIKVASMGQQASTDHTQAMGRSLLRSTIWGGLGAMIGWALLSAWPSLVFYTLLVGLAGLLMGRRIFMGPGMHPDFSMWSYAFMTMIILLGPAVVDNPVTGGSGAAIWSRLFLFLLIAIYGTASVAVFDAFWPGKRAPAAN